MATDLKVPSLGESVTEATVAKWLKRPGEAVALDEPVVELETDKVTLEVSAPAAGTLAEILAEEGANLPVGAVLGRISEGVAEPAPHPGPLPARGEREGPAQRVGEGPQATESRPTARGGAMALERSGPAVRKLIEENGLDAARIAPTGPGDRITKADVSGPWLAQSLSRRVRPRQLLPHRLQPRRCQRPASAKSGCGCLDCGGASPSG